MIMARSWLTSAIRRRVTRCTEHAAHGSSMAPLGLVALSVCLPPLLILECVQKRRFERLRATGHLDVLVRFLAH